MACEALLAGRALRTCLPAATAGPRELRSGGCLRRGLPAPQLAALPGELQLLFERSPPPALRLGGARSFWILLLQPVCGAPGSTAEPAAGTLQPPARHLARNSEVKSLFASPGWARCRWPARRKLLACETQLARTSSTIRGRGSPFRPSSNTCGAAQVKLSAAPRWHVTFGEPPVLPPRRSDRRPRAVVSIVEP